MHIKNKLAIFDIDGTLTDSVQVHRAAFASALEEMGFTGFDADWNHYKHHTDSYIFGVIFRQQSGKDSTQEDIEKFEIALNRHVSIEALKKPITQIRAANYFLEQLVLHSYYDIVLATGSLLMPAKQKLTLANIPVHDDLIVAANEIESREGLIACAIEKAKRYYHQEHYEVIVSFGDGLWDFETSKNCGINFVGIGNKKLLEYGVADFFTDFSDPALFALLNVESTTPQHFNIKPAGPVSIEFINRNVFTFYEATQFVRKLPYKRNANKADIITVLTDGFGTCSTKHALLKQLAIENNADFVKLKLGIFKMSGRNTPRVAATLARYSLDFIPEAHNYLRIGDDIIDCTKTNSSKEDFIHDLISEIEIQPDQITDFKISFHKNVLENWLKENHATHYSLAEVWAIREECITALQR